MDAARTLAATAHARLTVLTVLPPRGNGSGTAGGLITRLHPDDRASADYQRFLAWLGPERGDGLARRPEIAVAFGVAGIEIGRVAGLRAADLVVLGRRSRGPHHRLILGETADALVRRSPTPALFVPEEVREIRRMLVALDGTERCMKVLESVLELAPVLGAMAIASVTVEPLLGDEASGPPPPARGRSLQLGEALPRYASLARSVGPIPLSVRRGDVVEEVLREIARWGADLLAVGYRRGGPPKLVGPTEIARNLLYAAPCAVLTVPL